MNIPTNTSFKDLFFHKKVSVIPRASYLKLEQYYNRKEKTVHAFFENTDDFEFYRTAINYIYRGYELKEYLQEGKQNVIDGYHEVDWTKYERPLVLFFADKDYDDIMFVSRIDAANFFYTKWYSIENYLVTEEAFVIVLKNFFTNMTPLLMGLLTKLFREAHIQFHYNVRTITRFILIFRRFKKELDLDRIVMTDFVVIDKMRVLEKKLVSRIKYKSITRDTEINHFYKKLIRCLTIKEILIAKCKAESSLINFENILQSHKSLKNLDEPKIYVRGKYELWFFTELIKTVEHAISGLYTEGLYDTTAPKPSLRFAVTNLNAFHLIASKLSCPPELNSFLNSNFNKIQ